MAQARRASASAAERRAGDREVDPVLPVDPAAVAPVRGSASECSESWRAAWTCGGNSPACDRRRGCRRAGRGAGLAADTETWSRGSLLRVVAAVVVYGGTRRVVVLDAPPAYTPRTLSAAGPARAPRRHGRTYLGRRRAFGGSAVRAPGDSRSSAQSAICGICARAAIRSWRRRSAAREPMAMAMARVTTRRGIRRCEGGRWRCVRQQHRPKAAATGKATPKQKSTARAQSAGGAGGDSIVAAGAAGLATSDRGLRGWTRQPKRQCKQPLGIFWPSINQGRSFVRARSVPLFDARPARRFWTSTWKGRRTRPGAALAAGRADAVAGTDALAGAFGGGGVHRSHDGRRLGFRLRSRRCRACVRSVGIGGFDQPSIGRSTTGASAAVLAGDGCADLPDGRDLEAAPMRRSATRRARPPRRPRSRAPIACARDRQRNPCSRIGARWRVEPVRRCLSGASLRAVGMDRRLDPDRRLRGHRIRLDADRLRLDADRLRLGMDRLRFDLNRLRFDLNQLRLDVNRLGLDIDRSARPAPHRPSSIPTLHAPAPLHDPSAPPERPVLTRRPDRFRLFGRRRRRRLRARLVHSRRRDPCQRRRPCRGGDRTPRTSNIQPRSSAASSAGSASGVAARPISPPCGRRAGSAVSGSSSRRRAGADLCRRRCLDQPAPPGSSSCAGWA